jgi:hypothetical protein
LLANATCGEKEHRVLGLFAAHHQTNVRLKAGEDDWTIAWNNA